MEHLPTLWDAEGVFLLRLVVAMILGGLVGIERQARGRAAGLRTNILVCIGSAAMVVVFQKLSLHYPESAESVIRMDPSRAAAGVITGIGFLGAGTIVKSQEFVHGLTTAASIWVVSAIGVTVGLGEYPLGVLLTILVLIALYTLHRLPVTGDQYSALRLQWEGDLSLLDELLVELQRERIHITNRSIVRHPKTGKCRATLGLRRRGVRKELSILGRLQSDERFDEVGWS